jgi:NDP-mannose synthase
MPIDDMPILEIVIRQLAHHGIRDITLAVGYLSELLMAYCGNGEKFGLKIEYSREEEPLGTAGPIALIPNLTESFFVMNGDLLATLDYSEMWSYHKERGAMATLALYQRDIKIDLGVIEAKDGWLTDYIEKPTYHYSVSAGIYIFEPAVLQYIERGKHLDLPELVLCLLKDDQKVNVYNFDGYWLDIGRHDDYETAIQEFLVHRKDFLPEE